MNYQVQAIETRYKGYRMRSRLEARWAVVLDHLNVKWEYEKEGFTLSNGRRYLPDFYLSEFDIWVEIKPGFDKDTADLLEVFAKDVGAILWLAGNPMQFESWLLCLDANRNSKVLCSACLKLNGFGEAKIFCYDMDAGIYYAGTDTHIVNGLVFPMLPDEKATESALMAGRAARFEFGESGA